jgi:hypothetical protein
MNYDEAKAVRAEAKAAGVQVDEYIRLGMAEDYYVTLILNFKRFESRHLDELREAIREEAELLLQARNNDAFDKRMGI